MDDQRILHDWNYHFVNRKWIYTAVTRTTYLSNVKFVVNDDIAPDFKKLTTYFKDKIKGYINQDKANDLDIDRDNYITVDWLQSQLKNVVLGVRTHLNMKFRQLVLHAI